MRIRSALSCLLVIAVVAGIQGMSGASPGVSSSDATAGRGSHRSEFAVPEGFTPAVVRNGVGRYFVVMEAPSVADKIAAAGRSGSRLSSGSQRSTARAATQSQSSAIAAARNAGAKIVFRYSRLVNGFSAQMSRDAAAALARRSDVKSVQPVSIVKRANESSVPFIGATKVWQRFGARGQGMEVAVVDTGIDYYHAGFGGSGDVADYENDDPTVIEPGTFPTSKVVAGYDFVGEDYDVLDGETGNDTPRPDFDPLDFDGHGSHTAGTCCGNGVPGSVGAGVAPRSKIHAYRVWDVGNSTDDVLVAAYERAVDPNQDGSTKDRVDVVSFSGGVTYGTLNSVEAVAAQRVVDVGTVFVASAGNEGNQPAGGSPYIVGTPAAARGVIAVAASIDQFVANVLTVNSPSGLTLPDNGIFVRQDWSAPIDSDITNDVIDSREFDPPSAPDGTPAASDALFCDTVPGADFEGKIALIFKGSTGDGDCDGTSKVFFAQEANASAVILWSGFGGAPFGLGPGEHVDEITIPAVMLSGPDSEVLADAASPNAPVSYNDQVVNVTLGAEGTVIPGFEDRMTDFTSEGPARLTNDLKPDISAPGADITSVGVGTGDGASVLSGTSMAAPHISGVATLLRQLHPKWSVAKIKAVIMNQAKKNLTDNFGNGPISATVQGAGRVQAFQSAKAQSVAWPGSLSFGLSQVSGTVQKTRRFSVQNYDNASHHYNLSAVDHYSGFGADLATIALSLNGTSFSPTKSFNLGAGKKRSVWARLTLDPSGISEPEQEYGWYYIVENVDGDVKIDQTTHGPKDTLRVPWHTTPLNASDTSASPEALDLSSGPATLTIAENGTGLTHADAYLLGAADEDDSFGEEDISHIGARSFTGSSIDGTAEGLPPGNDALADISWVDFLTFGDVPTEPVEFGVSTVGPHNTTESLEVDVLIDSGADGVFADDELQADYIAVKTPGGGTTCLFDLSLPDPFADCAATYFPDYNNFNTDVTGVVVDAQAIGLSDGNSEVAYQVTACTGLFSGDVPQQTCDTAGAFDEGTGTYEARLDTTDPALTFDPLVCGGFWRGLSACSTVQVDTGSAGPGDDPTILMLYPNNASGNTTQTVTTTTGP